MTIQWNKIFIMNVLCSFLNPLIAKYFLLVNFLYILPEDSSYALKVLVIKKFIGKHQALIFFFNYTDFFFKFVWFFFHYSWFTVLCQFLLYSKVTQSHTYLYSFSQIILHHAPSQVTRYSFPVLYSRISLLILSKCNGLHLLTPNSQCIPTPPPWQPQVFSPSPRVSFLWKGSFV